MARPKGQQIYGKEKYIYILYSKQIFPVCYPKTTECPPINLPRTLSFQSFDGLKGQL